MPRTLPLIVAGAATAGIAIGALAMTALNPKPLGYVAPTPPAVSLSATPSETPSPSPTPSPSTNQPAAASDDPIQTAAAKPTAQQTMPRMMGAREDDAIAVFRDLGVRNVSIVDVTTSEEAQDGLVQWQDPGHHMPIGPDTRVRLGVGRWAGTDESHITRAPQPATTSRPTANATEGVTDESQAKQDVVWSPVLPEGEGNQQPCQPPAVYVPEKNACATYQNGGA